MQHCSSFAERTVRGTADSTAVNPRGRTWWKTASHQKHSIARVFSSDGKSCCQDHELLFQGKVCSVCHRHSLSGKLDNLRGTFGICRWSYGWSGGELPHEIEAVLLTMDESTRPVD